MGLTDCCSCSKAWSRAVGWRLKRRRPGGDAAARRCDRRLRCWRMRRWTACPLSTDARWTRWLPASTPTLACAMRLAVLGLAAVGSLSRAPRAASVLSGTRRARQHSRHKTPCPEFSFDNRPRAACPRCAACCWACTALQCCAMMSWARRHCSTCCCATTLPTACTTRYVCVCLGEGRQPPLPRNLDGVLAWAGSRPPPSPARSHHHPTRTPSRLSACVPKRSARACHARRSRPAATCTTWDASVRWAGEGGGSLLPATAPLPGGCVARGR